MYFQSLLLVPIVLKLVSAKECTDATLSLSLSARQGIFSIDIPQTNSDVVDFVLNVTQQGRNFTDDVLTGYQTVSNNYNISTVFCKPSDDTSTNPSVQILTHGIGFDKSYWDIDYNGDESYSYIDLATDTYKYYTLSYDRLGVGNSSHGETLNEIQAPLEVAALQALSLLLRAGTFPGVGQAFSKIIHVGHSFGSILSYSLADQYPELSDALVLTGFSLDSASLGLWVAGNHFVLTDPDQQFPDGYLVPADEEAIKYCHLQPGFFDDDILKLAEETKQPVTLGEALTVLSITPKNSFTNPVLVITGDSDLPFCGSNCSATASYDPTLPSIPAAVGVSFPGVAPTNFTAYIQPDIAHAINFHHNATGANTVIQEFINSKGLGST